MTEKDYHINQFEVIKFWSRRQSTKVIVIGALDDGRDYEEVLLLLLEPMMAGTDKQSIIFGYFDKDSDAGSCCCRTIWIGTTTTRRCRCRYCWCSRRGRVLLE